jgi:L-alanine-DL-glutamate epimerase-like enolase superfamily enzyme
VKHAKIKEIRAYIIDPGEAGADYHNQGKGHWIVDKLLPKDGYLDLPDKPGWGVELNRDKLKQVRPYAP